MRSVSLSQTSTTAETVLKGALPEAVYVHVPFCRHKCHYCDFYSIVDGRDREGDFVRRLAEELAATSELVDLSRVKTIFIGGGTPTLLNATLLDRMLLEINKHIVESTTSLQEWTIEVNPETLDGTKAQILVEHGVSRVSIGCQSFSPRLLKALERQHDPRSVPQAIEYARLAGIEHLSLDLIFGVPTSTLEEWENDLEQTVALGPDHLSCYALTFEPGTALYEKRRLGLVHELDDALQIEMYNHTRDRLEACFEQYEISNWAKPGGKCEHNQLYWRNADWLALGPAASGHIQGTRWRNIPRLDTWLSNGPLSPIVDREDPEPSRTVGERLMLGLRLTAGLSDEVLNDMLSADASNEIRRREVLDQGLLDGTLWRRGNGVAFSRAGVLQADGFLADLL